MPKQSYLAELGKLLTYMTPWDRERTLEYIGKRFDEAENEAALLQELGTPVRLAVLYNRGYNPSPDPALAAEEASPAQEEISAPPQWEKDEAESAPEEEAPSAEEPTAEAPEAQEAAEEAAEAPAAENAPEEPDAEEIPAEETAPESVEAEEACEEAAAEEESAETEPEEQSEEQPEEAPAVPETPETRKKPGFGRVLAVTVLSIFPGLPLFLLLMIIDVLLLVPGVAGIGAGLILVEAGTFSLTYMADALLVFGAALIVFALALLLLYGGLWCAVKLTKVYFKGICALMRAILGKGGRGK